MRVKPLLIIRTFKKKGNAKDTASLLDIHKSTVYRWIEKARSIHSRLELSEKNLVRKSTKPHTIHTAINRKAESDIIRVREETGYAAIKIKGELKLEAGINTIHRLLGAKGLLNKYGNHIRPRYQETTHMHLSNTKTIGYLQMDVKYITPELSGLPISKGLLNKYGNHIRPRYQETTHMHLSNTKTIGYLQMDVKYITPELSGLPYTCFEY